MEMRLSDQRGRGSGCFCCRVSVVGGGGTRSEAFQVFGSSLQDTEEMRPWGLRWWELRAGVKCWLFLFLLTISLPLFQTLFHVTPFLSFVAPLLLLRNVWLSFSFFSLEFYFSLTPFFSYVMKTVFYLLLRCHFDTILFSLLDF